MNKLICEKITINNDKKFVLKENYLEQIVIKENKFNLTKIKDTFLVKLNSEGKLQWVE